jgi:diaminohydroxyphosphoribosylaminopyrimidine deaminase / 5-amino-6-(5-phosphoribosylamino)uracil reductase
VRVVLDTQLRLPPTSALARTARQIPVWLIAGHAAAGEAEAQLRAHGVEILRVDEIARKLDLRAVMALLAQRGITRLMVEGGPILAAQLLKADLVDAAVLLHAPKALGEGIDALEGMPLTAVTQSPRLAARAIETAGADRIELYERR